MTTSYNKRETQASKHTKLYRYIKHDPKDNKIAIRGEFSCTRNPIFIPTKEKIVF